MKHEASILICLLLLAGSLNDAEAAQNVMWNQNKVESSSGTGESEEGKEEDFRVQSLTISGDDDDDPKVCLNAEDGECGVYLTVDLEEGNFSIGIAEKDIMTISTDRQITLDAKEVNVTDLNIEGSLNADGLVQWKLVSQEGFWTAPVGWSFTETSTCGGVYLLGGYELTSTIPLSKTFSNLVDHTEIRIVATIHYIDAWSGETAYLKANVGNAGAFEYLWTDSYDSSSGRDNINICGAYYGEGQFSNKIDVSIPHSSSEIQITIGTTLNQDPSDESYGISDFQIYVR